MQIETREILFKYLIGVNSKYLYDYMTVQGMYTFQFYNRKHCQVVFEK